MRRPAAAASRRCFAKLPAGSVSPGEELRRARGVLTRRHSNGAEAPRSVRDRARGHRALVTGQPRPSLLIASTSKMTQFERFHGADLIFKGDHVCYFCVFLFACKVFVFFSVLIFLGAVTWWKCRDVNFASTSPPFSCLLGELYFFPAEIRTVSRAIFQTFPRERDCK